MPHGVSLRGLRTGMRVQAPCSHCPHPVLARVPEPGLQAALESYGGQDGSFLGACLDPATPFSAACRHSRQAAEARLVERWRAKVLWRGGRSHLGRVSLQR